MRYDIIGELCYKNDWYYVTKDEKVLRTKRTIPYPCRPDVSYKKFNDEKYFDVIDIVEGELEEKINILIQDDNI